MPNILLTYSCVRNCPYCFASDEKNKSSKPKFLSWNNLVYIADLCSAAGERKIQLLGGEPTLHPDFLDMTIYLLERGFDITVFTSGILKNKALADISSALANTPANRLTFNCNLNDPEQTPSPMAEQESVRSFLSQLGYRTTPGFNIYRTDFKLEFLFQTISEFGMFRMIRLGLTHPVPGSSNSYISPGEIPGVYSRLCSYVPYMERFKIRLRFDCGFPYCGLDKDQLSSLYPIVNGAFHFNCAPIIDIGPDMTVWSCFPLRNYQRRSIFDFDSLDQIKDHFRKLHDIIRVEEAGIYEECDGCVWREDKLCSGGCLGHGVKKFREEYPLRMREVYP